MTTTLTTNFGLVRAFNRVGGWGLGTADLALNRNSAQLRMTVTLVNPGSGACSGRLSGLRRDRLLMSYSWKTSECIRYPSPGA